MHRAVKFIFYIVACCFELLLVNYIKIHTNTHHTPVQSLLLFWTVNLKFSQLTRLAGRPKNPRRVFFFLGIFHILDAKAKNKLMCKA